MRDNLKIKSIFDHIHTQKVEVVCHTNLIFHKFLINLLLIQHASIYIEAILEIVQIICFN